MDLIERLEKAEVGSRELDYLIHGAIKGWRLPTEEHSFTFWIGDSFQYGSPDKERLAIYIKEYELPDYTTSLDAALSLVPEGWRWQISDRAPKPHCGRAYLHNRELQLTGFGGARNPAFRHAEETAATPALALVIAALKARQSQEAR